MEKTRIQKVLASAGIASRRTIETMVLEGRISVNGRAVAKLPCFIEDDDLIRVDGKKIKWNAPHHKIYFLLNKPKGVVCTQSDPQGRPRAIDVIIGPKKHQRIYCVGRLDVDSTGLLILTNDGEFTQRLTHPSYGVPKKYVVQVDGEMTSHKIDKLKAGMHLDGKRTRPVLVKILRRNSKLTLLEVRLHEGRNREIRRLLAYLGYTVRRLKRTAIGPITDRGLGIGKFRILTPEEIKKLQGDDKTANKPPRLKARRVRLRRDTKRNVKNTKKKP